MYRRALVPDDFRVPERFEGEGFHLRMLMAVDVIKDFAAVMDSAARLVGLMKPGGSWPLDLTIEENLVDLGWHQREFTMRNSFAYTVMNSDESRCLGCCYIYPSDHESFDAEAYYWARQREHDAGFETILGSAFREFLATEWPFKSIAFPGRDIAWSDW